MFFSFHKMFSRHFLHIWYFLRCIVWKITLYAKHSVVGSTSQKLFNLSEPTHMRRNYFFIQTDRQRQTQTQRDRETAKQNQTDVPVWGACVVRFLRTVQEIRRSIKISFVVSRSHIGFRHLTCQEVLIFIQMPYGFLSSCLSQEMLTAFMLQAGHRQTTGQNP